MASDFNWLENVPSSVSPIPTYEPDFSFLQSMQMKANMQYQQGLSQVKSVYSSVFNKPVTDEANVVKQREYAHEAQNKMKDISASDLSDPRNQQIAENIITPYLDDKLMVQDQAMTANVDAELQKAESARTSQDDKVRAGYDSRIEQLLQYQKDNLRHANRDANTYNSLEFDKWTPFEDPMTALNGQVNASKTGDSKNFSVSYEIPDGNGGKITIVNGPSSLPNYRTYANSIMGTKFNKQYELLAKLKKEQEVRDYMNGNPGMTRQDAIRTIAAPYYEKTMAAYKSMNADLQHSIDMRQADLEKQMKAVGNGNPTQTQAYNIQKLNAEIAAYKEQQGTYLQHTKELGKDIGKNAFLTRPEGAMAQAMRIEDIDRWAQGMASNEQHKYEKDDVYWARDTSKREWSQYAEMVRNNKMNNQIEMFKAQTGQDKLALDWKIAKLEHPEIDEQNSGYHYGGKATTDEYTQDGATSATNAITKANNEIYTGLYSPDAMGKTLDYVPTTLVSSDDKSQFLHFMTKVNTGQIETSKDDKGNVIYKGATNPNEVAAFKKVTNFLMKESGMPAGQITSENAGKAYMQYVAKYLKKNPDGAESQQIARLYSDVKEKIATVENFNSEVDRNMKAYLAHTKDKSIQKGLINGRLISEADIAKNIPVKELTAYDEDGHEVKLSRETIAHAIATNQLTDYGTEANPLNRYPGAQQKPYIEIGKKRFNLAPNKGWFHNVSTGLIGMHNEELEKQIAEGSNFVRHLNAMGFKEIGEARQTIMKNVIGQTTLARVKQNQLGSWYEGNNVDKSNFAQRRLTELATPGNYTSMSVSTPGTAGREEIVNPVEQSVVRKLLMSKDYQNYIGLTHRYLTDNADGKEAAEITIVADKDQLPSYAQDLAGKTIQIEKSPTAQGLLLNKFPIKIDDGQHKLNLGERIVSDPVESEANKFHYNIKQYPLGQVNPEFYEAEVTRTVRLNGQDSTVTTHARKPASQVTATEFTRAIQNASELSRQQYWAEVEKEKHKANQPAHATN